MIALLRGINVSGQKKVIMAELRAMCEKMGFQKVKTYIQSGNIVFDTKETDTAKLATAIRNQILATFGYEVKVLVRSQAYFQEVLENNPFLTEAADIKCLYVAFLSAIPDPELVKKLEAIDYGSDAFRVIEDRLYLYYPNGAGRTKLTNNALERVLKIDATSRNWRSVNKIFELAEK